MSEKCVWVIESAVFDSVGQRTERWDIWQCFNTRAEAREHIRLSEEPKLNRMRKYVPASRPDGKRRNRWL